MVSPAAHPSVHSDRVTLLKINDQFQGTVAYSGGQKCGTCSGGCLGRVRELAWADRMGPARHWDYG